MRHDMRKQYADWMRAYAVDKKVEGGFGEDLGDADSAIVAPQASARDHHVSRLADLLCEASDGEVDRPAALRWLLHHRDGRALVTGLHKHEKGFSMQDRADELEAVVKRHGSFTGLCKSVAAGRYSGVTKTELALLGKGYAQREFPHLQPDSAFNRKFGDARASEAARSFWAAVEAAPVA